MWLFFALLAPLFFAMVHVIDSYCVEEIFERPWMGVVTSSFASLVVFLSVPFVAPFVSWEIVPWAAALAFFTGILIQISQGFYFQALSYSEAGIVASYWNMIPTMLPIFTFFLFGRTLELQQYTGIVVLIASSVIFCLLDTNLHWRWFSFFLMFCASLMQVFSYIIQDIVFDSAPFFISYLFIIGGIIFTGILPLSFFRFRKLFIKNTVVVSATSIFIFVEILNLLALISAEKAIDLGRPSLVAAVETTMPAHTFLLALLLVFITHRFGDPRAKHKIFAKLSLVGVMVFGVWLVH